MYQDKRDRIAGYVRPDLKRLVERIAAAEHRSISETAGILIAEAVGSRRRRGLAPYLDGKGEGM